MVTGAAMSASAQSATETRRAFAGISFAPTTTASAVSPISFKTSIAPAPRQAGDMPWNPIVLAGFNAASGPGVGFGAGIQMANVGGREEFGLQIDALFSLISGCNGCDAFGNDFSAKQLAFAGAFIYKFKEAANGWQPFAGGGPVVTRYSYSLDDNGFDACDITGFDCSVTSVGLQVQGGIAKGNLQIEGRVQGTAGGAFLGLVGYKFGRR